MNNTGRGALLALLTVVGMTCVSFVHSYGDGDGAWAASTRITALFAFGAFVCAGESE